MSRAKIHKFVSVAWYDEKIIKTACGRDGDASFEWASVPKKHRCPSCDKKNKRDIKLTPKDFGYR